MATPKLPKDTGPHQMELRGLRAAQCDRVVRRRKYPRPPYLPERARNAPSARESKASDLRVPSIPGLSFENAKRREGRERLARGRGCGEVPRCLSAPRP